MIASASSAIAKRQNSIEGAPTPSEYNSRAISGIVPTIALPHIAARTAGQGRVAIVPIVACSTPDPVKSSYETELAAEVFIACIGRM
jgi:hypothetical protein